ncbi:MAG: hypothetical protein JKY56_18415 [Kofleriaceae bacterium]|nr:hypothetical protein [Kofleriaceae bacterium]
MNTYLAFLPVVALACAAKTPEPVTNAITPPQSEEADPGKGQVSPAIGSAIFVDGNGLGILEGDKRRWLLPKQEIGFCAVDNKAQVVWLVVGQRLATYDLVDSKLRYMSPELEGGIGDILINHGDEQIGGENMVDPTIYLGVFLGDKIQFKSVVGCDGDGAWYCYENFDGESADDWPLIPELAKKKSAYDAVTAIDKDYLISLRTRGQNRKLWSEIPTEEAPRVSVPVAACDEEPGECGQATHLNERYWRVVVSNARGDYYHQDEQLYDSVNKEFIDARSGQRSQAPSKDSGGITGMLVSPVGDQVLLHDTLLPLEGGKLTTVDGHFCGWVGGGFRIPGPFG